MSLDQDAVRHYAHVFEAITPESLDELEVLLADGVLFRDPFNTLHGKRDFMRVFEHMYETCTEPAFQIHDIGFGEHAAYLRWTMTAKLKSWPRTALHFEGMSEVMTDTEGHISAHIDHWDSASQLLACLPGIGWLIRRILKLFQLGPATEG